MADHEAGATPTRPEPLLHQTSWAKTVAALTPAILAALALAGVHTQLTAAQIEAFASSSVLVGAVNWLAVHVAALRARRHVTPLADPHTVDGEQLVALSVAKTLPATNAANAVASVPLESEGELVATPWDEDDAVVRAAA